MLTTKELNDVTVVMTWYGQEDHLMNQMEFYNRMANRYKQLLPRLIVINDGHEEGRQFFRNCIKVHRERFNLIGIDVMEDVGFNSHACRNLGVKHAVTDWVYLMDADCYETHGLYTHLRFEKELDNSMFYVPKCDMESPEEMSGYELLCPKGIIKYKTHPNTWIMTRECFWSTGGYDIECQGVRHGDAEFFTAIGRPGWKEWDYDLVSEDDSKRMVVKTPRRDTFYIRQERGKQKQAAQIINYMRVKNKNPYHKYRKTLWNSPYELV